MSKGGSLFYQGQDYDVGTVVRIKTKNKGEIVTTFLGYGRYDGLGIHDYYSGMPSQYYIVEIIKPVYYKEPKLEPTKKASWDTDDDVFHGFLLYLAVMLGGIIFKDRFLIWMVATIIFFGWKAKK